MTILKAFYILSHTLMLLILRAGNLNIPQFLSYYSFPIM